MRRSGSTWAASAFSLHGWSDVACVLVIVALRGFCAIGDWHYSR